MHCCRILNGIKNNNVFIVLTQKQLIAYEMIEENIRMTSPLNDEGKTSMFQDVEAKRKTENDYFCGTIVDLGKELGIETPVCALLQQLIKCVETAF